MIFISSIKDPKDPLIFLISRLNKPSGTVIVMMILRMKNSAIRIDVSILAPDKRF